MSFEGMLLYESDLVARSFYVPESVAENVLVGDHALS